MQEHTSLKYLSIPLSLSRIFNYTLFTIAVGIEQSILFNLKASSNIESSAEYKGYYPQYFNLTIDQNGYYDFGNYQLKSKNEFYAKNLFYLTSLFVEFQRRINNNSMITFALIAQTNTSKMVDKSSKDYISRNSGELYSLSSVQNGYEINNVLMQIAYSINF